MSPKKKKKKKKKKKVWHQPANQHAQSNNHISPHENLVENTLTAVTHQGIHLHYNFVSWIKWTLCCKITLLESELLEMHLKEGSVVG